MEQDRRQLSLTHLADGGHEAWEFEAIDSVDDCVGLSAGLVLQGRIAWWWTAICGVGRETVAVIDDQVPVPRWPSLEVRTSGLWADVGIQEPGEHLTVDLEAFGVEVDEPDALLGDARGIRRPVGLDVEWHRAGPTTDLDDGHMIPARVEGEILIGNDVIELSNSTTGSWTHRAGTGPWWGPAATHPPTGQAVASVAVNVGGWSWRRSVEAAESGGLSWAVTLVGSPDGRRSD